MNPSYESTLHPHSKAIRIFCLIIALTAGLSLLYGTQYFLGGPVRLPVTSQIHDLARSPDGALVAAGAEDGKLHLWNTQNGWTERILSGHTGTVTSLAFGPNGSTLYSAGQDGFIRVWNVASGQTENEIDAGEGRLDGLALSETGSVLAVIAQTSVVRVFDAQSWQELQTFEVGGEARRAVAVSPNGELVAAGDGENIQIWNARTGEAVQRLEGYYEDPEDQEDWLGHEADVTALAFSPDGTHLASGGGTGTTLIWSLEENAVDGETRGHLAAVLDIAYDPAGNYVLSGGDDNFVRRWQVPGGRFAGVFRGHLGAVSGVAFGFQPDTIFSAGTDGSVRLWETVNSQQLYLAWTQVGFMPIWGPVTALWLLGSGIVGLILAWGLWRVRTWAYLGALGLYVIGPLFTVVFPLLETISYPITFSTRVSIGWPLVVMLVWYTGIVAYLRRDEVAIPYQAPDAASLADQLMAARRSASLRRSLFIGAMWLFIFVLLFTVLRSFGLDIAFMRKWFPFIMGGAGLTLFVSAAAILLATVLALLGALGRLSENPVTNGIAGFYVSLIRGTPLLVQIFIWFLALPQLGLTLPPIPAGVLALGVNYGAYMTEIFRAGIQAIGIGQYEAAYALGMSGSQTFRRIVLPQAFRIVIPPIGNQFIAMMKDSSLVSIITVQELTFRAQKVGRQNFRNLETFLIAAAFYWILTIVFQYLQSRVETYMARGERRSS